MTPKEEGALLTDIAWIKGTLEKRLNDPDLKNVGAYKKMTWFNFAGLVGLCWFSIRAFIMKG